MQLPGFQWTPSEASAVNDFLSSPVGVKWIKVLTSRKPRIDMLSTDRAALSGSFAAGYEQVFVEIAATRATITDQTSGLRPIDPTRD